MIILWLVVCDKPQPSGFAWHNSISVQKWQEILVNQTAIRLPRFSYQQQPIIKDSMKLEYMSDNSPKYCLAHINNTS